MGLGFSLVAQLPLSDAQPSPPPDDEIVASVVSAVAQSLADPLLLDFLEAERTEDGLTLSFHPAAEPMEIRIHDGRRLSIAAKTSTVGPGYHAYLVQLVDDIIRRLGAHSDWLDADGEPGDETGYQASGDFAALQQEMARWLSNLASHVAGAPAPVSQVNMPLGYPVAADAIMTPVGPLPPSFFQELTTAEGSALHTLCAQFFPWWSAGLDAHAWRGFLTVLLWCDIGWHPPLDDEAKGLYRRALRCVERIGDAEAFAEERAELTELLERASDDARPPRAEGRGYRRGVVTHALPGGWSLRLPGYYHAAVDEEDDAQIWWFGPRTVRFSAMLKQGTSDDGARQLVKDRTEPGAHVRDEGSLYGTATFHPASDEKGWVLIGELGSGVSLGIITVFFGDEQDRDWALEVFGSVGHVR